MHPPQRTALYWQRIEQRLRHNICARGGATNRGTPALRACAVSLQRNLDTQAAYLKGPLELNGRSLPISTLRGQHVDNREWLDDPASTAIIVGTIDMIGSRLLFEGYGVARNMQRLICACCFSRISS